jgi:hypothetical protein
MAASMARRIEQSGDDRAIFAETPVVGAATAERAAQNRFSSAFRWSRLGADGEKRGFGGSTWRRCGK